MLKLGALFHLNLMYSSIPVAARADVIRRCYHPLLDLAESGVPLAIEATGLTLEMIADLDAGWITRLRGLLADGRVEYVGSGHAQIIGPLAPAAVNARNLALGRATAERLLDVTPGLWLVNEMAWSGGLAGLYHEIGARAVIMEWNNPRRGHPEWDGDLRYHRQCAIGPDGVEIPLIWIDTIDFQTLQRFTAGEIELDAYLAHWRGRRTPDGRRRQAMFYGSDAEVFDYRPGRYRQERHAAPAGEWERMGLATAALAREPGIELALLSAWLDEPDSDVCGRSLRLESTAQPVVVKKQEKYNLNRWAVTGRGDLELNTTCHALAAELAEAPDNDPRWRDLCSLWASDLRTHLTADRWAEVVPQLRIAAAPHETKALDGPRTTEPRTSDLRIIESGDIELAGDGVTLRLNPRRGLAARSLRFDALGGAPVLGTLNLGYFDDIALGADFYTGHAVVQHPGESKLSDLAPVDVQGGRRPDGLTAAADMTDGELSVRKEWTVLDAGPAVRLRGELALPARRAGEVHPLHLTIVPGLFNAARLGFAVRNGGRTREVFRLEDGHVHHGQAYSTLVTAKGGLGCTDGELLIGDDTHRLVIRHDPTVSALVPTVRFVPGRVPHPDRYFLRVRYSAQEIDETFVPDDRPWQMSWSLTITAENRPLEAP